MNPDKNISFGFLSTDNKMERYVCINNNFLRITRYSQHNLLLFCSLSNFTFCELNSTYNLIHALEYLQRPAVYYTSLIQQRTAINIVR